MDCFGTYFKETFEGTFEGWPGTFWRSLWSEIKLLCSLVSLRPSQVLEGGLNLFTSSFEGCEPSKVPLKGGDLRRYLRRVGTFEGPFEGPFLKVPLKVPSKVCTFEGRSPWTFSASPPSPAPRQRTFVEGLKGPDLRRYLRRRVLTDYPVLSLSPESNWRHWRWRKAARMVEAAWPPCWASSLMARQEARKSFMEELAQAPSPCLNPEKASFADRISLRQQVVTEDPDPDLVEALAKKNVKMHTKEEENPREGSKVFHPAASKALKIKQAVMLEPVEPPKVDEAKIDEMVDLTTEVLGEMQSGALSVADKEGRGAQLLRQLGMNHFRDCLKRSYLDGPGANIAQAQATIEEARRQNLARHGQDGDWDWWDHGGQHPSPIQVGRDDPSMQPSLGRTSSIWRGLEIGMGRVQPPGMGEEDEAAGAYSPRTADSPFRHANLEISTMHLHGAGHPSPGSTRPASRSSHSGWWLLGSTGRCPPLVSADSDLVIAGPVPCLWQQLDHEGALRHLVWNADDSEVPKARVWAHYERAPGQPSEDPWRCGALLGCQQSWTAPEFLGVATVLPWVGEVPCDEGLLDEHPRGGDGDPGGPHQWHQRAHDHEGNLWWEDQPSHGCIQGVPTVGDMMDVKVAWRCNPSIGTVRCPQPRLVPSTTSWATVRPQSQQWDWTPMGAPSPWRPKERRCWGKELTALNLPLPYCSIEADDGKTYEEARKPPITVHNAVSALGKDYMKKNYPGGGRHAFWGQMECGLVLSSVSPWEMVQKEKGVTRGGYVCKWCRGFWKGKMGTSRLHRAGRFCNLCLMSPQSASTTVGWRTVLSSTSGWSRQPLSGMCPWRWTQTLSTAFASVFPTAWATSVMQSGPWFLRRELDSFILGLVRFQVGCSARFNDLQHTAPSTMRHTTNTLEFAAWQTKTVSATRIRKHPVPLICPKFSFTGHVWWQPLLTWWTRLSSHPAFEAIDYLIPTISKDGMGFISRPGQADRTLRLHQREEECGGQSVASSGQWDGRDLYPWQTSPGGLEPSGLGWLTNSPWDLPTENQGTSIGVCGLTRRIGRCRRHTSQGESALGFGGESRRWHPGDIRTPTGTTTSATSQNSCRHARSPEWTSESCFIIQEVGTWRHIQIPPSYHREQSGGLRVAAPIDKAQDLNPLDHRSEPHCYQECARCFRLFGFPTDWPVDSHRVEEDSEFSSSSADSLTDDSVDTASETEKVTAEILKSGCTKWPYHQGDYILHWW